MALNYKLTNGDKVIRTCEGYLPQVVQPGNEGLNSMWAEYQSWLSKGNKPLPADVTSIWDAPRDLVSELDEVKQRLSFLEVK